MGQRVSTRAENFIARTPAGAMSHLRRFEFDAVVINRVFHMNGKLPLDATDHAVRPRNATFLPMIARETPIPRHVIGAESPLSTAFDCYCGGRELSNARASAQLAASICGSPPRAGDNCQPSFLSAWLTADCRGLAECSYRVEID